MRFLFLFFCSFITTCYANQYNFTDPYPEVYKQITPLPFYCHGWTVHEYFFDDLFKKRTFKTVTEVGVFLGKWTMYVAEKLPKNTRFFAVDHWKGSTEHYVEGSDEKKLLKNLYQQFLSNMIHRKLTDRVIPVRTDSLTAAKKFAELGIKSDLIYIDAAHDYIAVLRDLYAWYPLLETGGVFCGDDWNCGGVQLAVQQFAKKNGLKIILHGSCWELVYPN